MLIYNTDKVFLCQDKIWGAGGVLQGEELRERPVSNWLQEEPRKTVSYVDNLGGRFIRLGR